ncbi:MAG: D-alanyl-D-alanine carboxypeptidase/D-alanyl-D-alanine-endopeptidase [Burkholderiales bacterium]|nr:MAG: D-alanyl-D-alanine carboxypeptidase/D-alanyl-D-alanine-endopeptidase [Burkholderiales bacterium]
MSTLHSRSPPRAGARWRGWLAAFAGAAALVLPGCALSAVDTLPKPVRTALNKAGLPSGALSALVVAADGPARERLRHRADAEVNPASVMKLVTTYAALDLLGPEHTWTTEFRTDGEVAGGVLRGNLYVRGGGDPKLVLERLQETFMRLQDLGVRVILGDMVLDHSAFELPPHDPGAFDGESLRPYNTAPDALLVNFKSVILHFTPDAAAGVAWVRSEPPMEGLAIDASVPLSRSACGDWRAALQARFDDADRIRFEGRYPRGCGEREWPVAYQDPGSYAARAMEGMWRATGGAITGRVREGLTPPGTRLVHEAQSLPLSDIIADVNQWSNNVMAQQVFLTLGRLNLPPAMTEGRLSDRLAPERTARFDNAREVVTRWWRRTLGTRHPPPVMDNGAGLSRIERITPDALGALLRHAAAHPRGEQFVQSLSLAGVSGTAARYARAPGSQARGNAWLKTGTLRDVIGVAGYVQAANGTRYAVVALVNHEQAPAARPAIDALIEWVATLPD